MLCVNHQISHKNRNYLVGLTLRNEMMDYKVIPVGTLWYWISVWQYWLVLDGTGSVWGGTGWYLVVLGQCNLVLLDIKWNWVSTTLLCLYILKKVEIWSGVTIVGRRTRKDRATQPFDHRRLR